MPTTRNLGLIYTRVPNGAPIPGQDLQVKDRPIDLEKAEPAENSLLIKNLYFSYDPLVGVLLLFAFLCLGLIANRYQRGRMRDPSVKSYSQPYALDEPITNSSVSTVVKSNNPNFREGDIVTVLMACPIEEYTLLPASYLKQGAEIMGHSTVTKIDNPYNLDVKHWLHALGMPGITAYASFYGIAGPKFEKGETIWISSAAGAVGQIVGQLAKREGMKVIGSVGSNEKLAFIEKDLGFDSGWNYKNEKPAEALAKRAPDGIEVYYENVGGEQLEAAISAMKPHGRIVVCGMVSQYNKPPQEQYPVKNLTAMVRSRIKMQGFMVADPEMGPKYAEEHRENIMKWLAEGSLRAKIDVTDGMENAAEGFVGMLEGKNFGKAVLKV